MTDHDPAYTPRRGDPVRYHPLLNTIANVVTAVMSVVIVFRIF